MNAQFSKHLQKPQGCSGRCHLQGPSKPRFRESITIEVLSARTCDEISEARFEIGMEVGWTFSRDTETDRDCDEKIDRPPSTNSRTLHFSLRPSISTASALIVCKLHQRCAAPQQGGSLPKRCYIKTGQHHHLELGQIWPDLGFGMLLGYMKSQDAVCQVLLYSTRMSGRAGT